GLTSRPYGLSCLLGRFNGDLTPCLPAPFDVPAPVYPGLKHRFDEFTLRLLKKRLCGFQTHPGDLRLGLGLCTAKKARKTLAGPNSLGQAGNIFTRCLRDLILAL